MGKGKDKEPQEVVVTWEDRARDRKQREGLLYSSLFQVAWQVSQYCLSNNKTPEEVVPTFAKTFELLQDWFKGGTLRDQIQDMLETIAPEPVGYGPGETLSLLPHEEKPRKLDFSL